MLCEKFLKTDSCTSRLRAPEVFFGPPRVFSGQGITKACADVGPLPVFLQHWQRQLWETRSKVKQLKAVLKEQCVLQTVLRHKTYCNMSASKILASGSCKVQGYLPLPRFEVLHKTTVENFFIECKDANYLSFQRKVIFF